MNSRWTRLSIEGILDTMQSVSNASVNGCIHTTMPSTGFIARFAIPVLKDLDVMSRIAVPVVSEPVPAVVGMAMRGFRAWDIGNPLPTGALIKSKRSASL